MKGGSRHVMGVMIESHLVEGNQKLTADLPADLRQSVTDVTSIETTEELLVRLADAVAGVRCGLTNELLPEQADADRH